MCFTCFRNPLKVSLKGAGKVLAHAQFTKRFSPLHTRSFVTELSEIVQLDLLAKMYVFKSVQLIQMVIAVKVN